MATLRTAALVSVGAPANLTNPHVLFAFYKMPDPAVFAATQQLLNRGVRLTELLCALSADLVRS